MKNLRTKSVGYFSSYDRGLATLLKLWPSVLKQVPDASLSIYYGWDLYDKMRSQDPEAMKEKWEMIKLMQDPSITEYGRVSHRELAEAMEKIKVWAYPTEWTEINCITALKAQEAGMIPVTTDCYALETSIINNDFSVPCTDIYSNKAKQKMFCHKLVQALKYEGFNSKIDMSWYWPDVAEKWDEMLCI